MLARRHSREGGKETYREHTKAYIEFYEKTPYFLADSLVLEQSKGLVHIVIVSSPMSNIRYRTVQSLYVDIG